MEMKYKADRGVAGLTILLSLIVMLFVIGLLVMIFVIMGSKLQDSSYTSTVTTSVNETLAYPSTAGVTLTTGNSARNGVCGAVSIINGTTGSAGAVKIASGNYTQTGCVVKNTTAWVTYYTTNVRYTYSYTYDADNAGTIAINDTSNAIGGVTDWFDIFIVIGAMVVLILLTVIIITSIRGSGLVGGEMASNPSKVGTA
jgi:hypothetical protein